eukprot:Partr_v1_DN26954_c1_g2_i2_m6938 putative TBC1 domain family, member 5
MPSSGALWKKSLSEWQSLLDSVHSTAHILELAKSGGCDDLSRVRSVVWRVSLGQLTAPSAAVSIRSLCRDKWLVELESDRLAYSQLRDKFRAELSPSQRDDSGDPLHPLLPDEESPWSDAFKRAELEKLIMQDVERAFPDFDFFRRNETQRQMLNVLFVYCSLNPDLSYRQGMHEILAPLLHVVSETYLDVLDFPVDMDEFAAVKPLFDSRFVEHDTFALFTRVMSTLFNLFLPVDQRSMSPSISTPANNEIPIVKRCLIIQNGLLRAADPKLQQRLADLGIEPQLYGIRWLRLLYGREFSFDRLFTLWDIIFAHDGQQLSLMQWIAVALLKLMRESLMSGDSSVALQRLMKYPSDFEPVQVAKLAIELEEKYSGFTEWELLETAAQSRKSSSSAIIPKWVKSTQKSLMKDFKRTFEPMMAQAQATALSISSGSSPTKQLSEYNKEVILTAVEEQVVALEEMRVMVDDASSIYSDLLASVLLTRKCDSPVTSPTSPVTQQPHGDNIKRLEMLLKSLKVSIADTIRHLEGAVTESKQQQQQQQPANISPMESAESSGLNSIDNLASADGRKSQVASPSIHDLMSELDAETTHPILVSSESSKSSKHSRRKKLGDLLQ